MESGYDREAPDWKSASGLDVAREIDDPNGAPVREVKLGDTLEVHLRIRSEQPWVSAAVVDLLPAGFEVDLQSSELQSRRSLPGARPTARSMRSGWSALNMLNVSATLSGL